MFLEEFEEICTQLQVIPEPELFTCPQPALFLSSHAGRVSHTVAVGQGVGLGALRLWVRLPHLG